MVRIVPYTQQTQTPSRFRCRWLAASPRRPPLATPCRASARRHAPGERHRDEGKGRRHRERLGPQQPLRGGVVGGRGQRPREHGRRSNGRAERRISAFNKLADGFAREAPDKRTAEAFRRWADDYRTRQTASLLNHEASANVEYRYRQLDETLKAATTIAIKAPDEAPRKIAELEATIDAMPNIPQLKRDEWKRQAREQVAAGHYRGLAAIDPQRVYGELSGLGGAVRYLGPLKSAESGGRNVPNEAGTSSAFGPYQFTKGTWEALIKRHPQLGLTEADRFDPAKQERAIVAFTRDNVEALKAAGVAPTDKALYMTHFLGAAGGPRFMKGLEADPSQPATALATPDQVEANRSVFFRRDGTPKTAGEVYQTMTARFANTNHFEQATSGATPVAGSMDSYLAPNDRLSLLNATRQRVDEMATERAAQFDLRLDAAQAQAKRPACCRPTRRPRPSSWSATVRRGARPRTRRSRRRLRWPRTRSGCRV